MKRLIDQYGDALDLLGRRDPDSLGNAIIYGFHYLGGANEYETEGRLPPPPPGVKDKRKLGQVHGHHNLPQFLDRLSTVVDQYGMDEEFIVVNLIAWIDEQFERPVTGYARGKHNVRQAGEFWQSLVDDPERLAEWNANADRLDGEPMTAVEAQGMADHARQWGMGSVSELREHKEAWDLWREVMDRIIDEDNLEAFRDWELQQALEQMRKRRG